MRSRYSDAERIILATVLGLSTLQQCPWFPILHVLANPLSKPYIPFRTSPTDQDHLHHRLSWEDPAQGQSEVHSYDPENATPDNYCPLQFSLGVSRQLHHTASRKGGLSIVEPPVIFPLLPALGPGRQVLYTTQYEHLDMLTPLRSMPTGAEGLGSVIKEGLTQHSEFPLLFESSSFLASPVLADVNSDGIVDVILADYDGGIYAVGSRASSTTGKRYFHKAQIPRLFVRRQWVESRVNETLGIEPKAEGAEETDSELSMADDIPMDRYGGRDKPHDPYHTYFEYTYGSNYEHETILRGVTADVLGQDHEHMQGLEERRNRKIQHRSETTGSEPGGYFEDEEEFESPGDGEENHRRLQEVVVGPSEISHRRLEEVEPIREKVEFSIDEGDEGDEGEDNEDIEPLADDIYSNSFTDDIYSGFAGDDIYQGMGDDALDYPGEDSMEGADEDSEEAAPIYGDDDSQRYGDDGYPRYDDYYGRYSEENDNYYDDKHYVRIPPHILCTPVALELPKLYSQTGETETLLFLAVSYYLDEDEYDGFFSYKRFKDRDQGDETEVQRGMYVANAIMVYQYGESPRWGRQEHLDMSADHSAPINTTLVGSIPLQEDNSKLGAFALGSPTVADIDGDGSVDVLLGTSMGMVYVMDARNLYAREGWPIQLDRGVESRILVEDVQGDTNLEVFVADVGGNVVCLNHKGEKLWHRDLVSSVSNGVPGAEVLAASPMVIGDIDGDGSLDLVLTLQIRIPGVSEAKYLFGMSAVTGKDKNRFPIAIGKTDAATNNEEFVTKKLPAPLLVDLHSDQTWLAAYLKRGGGAFQKPSVIKQDPQPHGGPNIGIHIVLPVDSNLMITEAASGCAQTVSIGEPILAMAQVDDVHGTGGLDLVITTAMGNVVTLESAAPYHPLNVWNNGEMRGRSNAQAHGFGASQGIFVHDVSRQYRDIFGVYLPVTFELFDNRPNIRNEPNRRVYNVEVRVGTSQPIFRKTYTEVGTFTERMYIPHGAGYYQVTASLKTTHSIIYEDTFHLGYNVNYMEGFGIMLWLPLLLSTICVGLCSSRKSHWDDDDYDGDDDDGKQGILGGKLPE